MDFSEDVVAFLDVDGIGSELIGFVEDEGGL